LIATLVNFLLAIYRGEPPYVLERLNYLRDKEYQGLAEENPFHIKQ
jgi:hypothetical protein